MDKFSNDFIINVGPAENTVEPYESAHSEAEAISRAKELLLDGHGYTEVVYMPTDDFDVAEVVWRSTDKKN